MNSYELLFAHNAWANRQVLAACEAAPAGFLTAPGEGITTDSHIQRLEHLFAVERGFLDVLRGENKRPTPPQTLAAFTPYGEETLAGFERLLPGMDDVAAGRKVYVPWWEREFEVRDCLLQVLAHSSQHRSEVAWAISKVGVSTGELDYIGWIYSGRPAPGTPLA